jgi:8-oxo-dGTP diphosphatase
MLQRTRVGAYGIVVDGTRILLTQLALGADRGRWNLPGGGLDHGETPESALVREVREEAGLVVDSPVLFTVFTSQTVWAREGGESEDIHYVGIVFRARFAGGELRATGDGGSCSGARWFELADLTSVELSRGATRVLREAKLLP